VIGPGVITAAIERLRSDARLSRAEKRAVMLLAGGSVHAPRKALALPGKSRAERKAELRPSKAAAYEAVIARDGGRCTVRLERLGACEGVLHIDHQWGRGKAPTLLENCRQLCLRHDLMKTRNEPTRRDWLEDFREHALAHDYPAEIAKADGQIALELAQHPETTR
jgi:hypothetical protein